MSKGSLIVVAATVLRATSFGVMGTIAGVAFSAIDGGEGRFYWDSV